MLFSTKDDIAPDQSAEANPARTGGCPRASADSGKTRLGGGFRLPLSTTDHGKIRLGGGFRLPLANPGMSGST